MMVGATCGTTTPTLRLNPRSTSTPLRRWCYGWVGSLIGSPSPRTTLTSSTNSHWYSSKKASPTSTTAPRRRSKSNVKNALTHRADPALWKKTCDCLRTCAEDVLMKVLLHYA
eukprot:PhF_6_TR26048/c0_g1_i1/m.36678